MVDTFYGTNDRSSWAERQCLGAVPACRVLGGGRDGCSRGGGDGHNNEEDLEMCASNGASLPVYETSFTISGAKRLAVDSIILHAHLLSDEILALC